MSGKITLNHSKKAKILAHLGALFTVAIWGTSFVSTKVLLGAMGPVEIYIYRFVLAYVLLLAYSHKRLMAYSWRDEGIFLLCGLSSGSLYFIAENTALEHTLTTNVSLLTSTSPLLTALLVALLYRNQRMGSGMFIGAGVAFLGVACVIFNSNFALDINPLGDILSLVAALLWAVYGLMVKRLNPHYDIYFMTRKIFFYGVITAIPFWLEQGNFHNPIVLLQQPAILGNILFLGLGASLVCFVLWNLSIKQIGAITTNNYMYLQPVFTMIFSAIILSEKITVMGVTGCALILVGLWLGNWLSRRQGCTAGNF